MCACVRVCPCTCVYVFAECHIFLVRMRQDSPDEEFVERQQEVEDGVGDGERDQDVADGQLLEVATPHDDDGQNVPCHPNHLKTSTREMN